MAESYPQSKFYGIDIVRSFPESIKPVNVEFAIGNIAEPLPFENEKFDYIHQRLLALGLSDTEWDKVNMQSI
jgi:hypothetical protein